MVGVSDALLVNVKVSRQLLKPFDLVSEPQLFIVIKSDPSKLDLTFVVVGEFSHAVANIVSLIAPADEYQEDGLVVDKFAGCIDNTRIVILFREFNEEFCIVLSRNMVIVMDSPNMTVV